ncbi:hypothetical protein U8527_08290 [Kordia algicida OT-1]|uniref:Uncharacterized protein n=1 Tax=Kordia algicida OT-1 TaxID=391587 RepID=A9E6D1_9FLAO|nr:hypothetical protein [Kordia algicida]EDP95014.1 hypothetical protein KAOT1_01724 [Kordia algicida OT-1]
MHYYYIPQHSWGLYDQAEDGNITGFYSAQGGPCRPVTLWCSATNRGAFAHWDDDSLMTENLLYWLVNGDYENQITIYTTEDAMDEVNASILAINADTQILHDEIEIGIWGFTFDGDFGPIDVDNIPDNDLEEMPVNWSDYWGNAPDWQNGSTFSAQIILAINGFFANYNGRYYFDFH